MKPEGYVTDYNGCLVRGYHEIPLGYKLLQKSGKELNIKKVFKLFFIMQPKCWALTFKGELDKLTYVFEEHVLVGEDADFLNRYAGEIPFNNSNLQARLLKIPKVGKYFDTRINAEAISTVELAHKKGVKTGLWSSSFKQLTEGNLEENRRIHVFDEIKANPWIEEDGIITGIEYKVVDEDKSRGFPDFLGELGLKENGEGVAYVGESPSDFKIFSMVEFPFLAPNVSKKKRGRYQEEGLKNCMFPESYAEIAKELKLTD